MTTGRSAQASAVKAASCDEARGPGSETPGPDGHGEDVGLAARVRALLLGELYVTPRYIAVTDARCGSRLRVARRPACSCCFSCLKATAPRGWSCRSRHSVNRKKEPSHRSYLTDESDVRATVRDDELSSLATGIADHAGRDGGVEEVSAVACATARLTTPRNVTCVAGDGGEVPLQAQRGPALRRRRPSRAYASTHDLGPGRDGATARTRTVARTRATTRTHRHQTRTAIPTTRVRALTPTRTTTTARAAAATG